jgi:hypothetical protein
MMDMPAQPHSSGMKAFMDVDFWISFFFGDEWPFQFEWLKNDV